MGRITSMNEKTDYKWQVSRSTFKREPISLSKYYFFPINFKTWFLFPRRIRLGHFPDRNFRGLPEVWGSASYSTG